MMVENMDEKITRVEALKKIGLFLIGIGFVSFFAKRVFADVFFTGADTSTGVNVDFITYDIETGLLTLGKAGDIILGDSTQRDIYPQTTLKMDLGNTSYRFQEGWINQLHMQQAVDNVHDTTPTDAQLDTAFGTPATLGRGFIGTIDDASGETNFYLCVTTDNSWFWVKMTKAL